MFIELSKRLKEELGGMPLESALKFAYSPFSSSEHSGPLKEGFRLMIGEGLRELGLPQGFRTHAWYDRVENRFNVRVERVLSDDEGYVTARISTRNTYGTDGRGTISEVLRNPDSAYKVELSVRGKGFLAAMRDKEFVDKVFRPRFDDYLGLAHAGELSLDDLADSPEFEYAVQQRFTTIDEMAPVIESLGHAVGELISEPFFSGFEEEAPAARRVYTDEDIQAEADRLMRMPIDAARRRKNSMLGIMGAYLTFAPLVTALFAYQDTLPDTGGIVGWLSCMGVIAACELMFYKFIYSDAKETLDLLNQVIEARSE